MPIYILQGKTTKGKRTTMGMSATQANLLCLTSRLHDVENKAQFIEGEKLALATQQDEIYNTYCAALDATKIQVAFNNDEGKRYFVDATFDSVCTYDPTRCKQYSLTNAKTGKLYVTSEVKEAYKNFKDDKYSFAWEMLGLEGRWNGDWGRQGISVNEGGSALTTVEELIYRKHADGYGNDSSEINKTLDDLYKKYQATLSNPNATNNDKLEALFNFRDCLYSTYGNEIYALMRFDKNACHFPGFSDTKQDDVENGIYSYADFEEWARVNGNYGNYVEDDQKLGDATFPRDEFNYYVNLWTSITNAGGCEEVPIAAQMGNESNKWFNEMVKSGRAIINVYNENTKEWGETNVATSVNVNYLQENQDEKDLKKAEAEYEYQLSVIEKKDTEFDKELSKLETERSSIKQIMESIKTVKNENIDRTFNLFS